MLYQKFVAWVEALEIIRPVVYGPSSFWVHHNIAIILTCIYLHYGTLLCNDRLCKESCITEDMTKHFGVFFGSQCS